MRTVVQRCQQASVKVDGEVIGEVGKGMMVLVCVETGDTEEELQWMVRKLASLRIFDDENGVMNLDVKSAGGGVLAVSQFTLVASTRKGNRPSYIRAAKGEESERMYDRLCLELGRQLGIEVAKGRFGADMKVSLVNDGPVTIIIDSRLKE